MKGYIHQLESFGSVDGPGVRFIVFLAGCQFRCKYCHNPDTWIMSDGTEMEADDVLSEALSCRSYWGKRGGITVSGGEPLLQLDFLIDLFEKAKEKGVNTCIDTAGGSFTHEGEWLQKFNRLMRVTDILLVDIKHIEEDGHIALTGKSGKNVVDFFRYLDEIKKPIWIRHVLVPGITDDDALLFKTRDFIRTLSNVERVEILPYHGLAETKYKDLRIPYSLSGTESPSEERVENARRILECEKYDGWKR